jgi:lysophospholipase L1-like esterase
MIKKIFFSILVFYLTLEVSLRISGKFKSPNEISTGEYYCQYRQKSPTWYHYYKPNYTHLYKQLEFEYTNTYNELGSREKPFIAFLNDTTAKKIVCLGDSFTHGDGTSYDSSWVKQFEKNININKKNKTKLYNAGTCGSDVFFNNKLLVKDLIKLKPKLVIECVNTSDILDVIKRGGDERFNEDGTTLGKVGPKWEVIYQYSHVFRGIIHVFFKYNRNLIKRSELNQKKSKAIQMIKQKTEETASFCKKNGIPYILLIQPIPEDLKINQNQPLLFINQLSELPYSINLFKPMHKYYLLNHIENDSWDLNGHFNSNGYLVLANVIFEELQKKNELQYLFN